MYSAKINKNLRLLVQCAYNKAVISELSSAITKLNGNIINLQQHCDDISKNLFFRLDIEDILETHTLIDIHHNLKPLIDKFNLDLQLSKGAKRLCIMVSQYDHCLYDILLRHKYGELNVEIPLIISNHELIEKIAHEFYIPFFYVPVNDTSNKFQQEQQCLNLLKEHQIDFIALARYMQILSGPFIAHFPNKIINVHHGFLPAFKGAKPYHQAYDKGVKMIGATAHFVTEILDNGPIIAQDTIKVHRKDNILEYINKGRDIEKQVFAEAVKAFIEDKIILFNNRTIIFD